MSVKVQFNTVKMLRQLFDPTRSTRVCIPYAPQKTRSCILPFNSNQGAAYTAPFVHNDISRCAPEETGISSSYIADFIDKLSSDNSLNLHHITILRGDNIIFESSFGDYRLDVPHVCYSLSKSITATAIGMLVDAGRLSLDDLVTDIFSSELTPFQISTHKKLTVRHLLTMSSGVVFNEAGSVTETDWFRGFFDSLVFFSPGTKFNYNSMNSYILSCIVKKVSGLGLMDFLADKFWSPLGIDNVYWELSPTGIEKGGWGLYICPEDLAKIGRLYMKRGVWNGARLISSDWISDAVSEKIKAPETCGDFNYGYHIWTGRHDSSFLFNGMFGQNMICFPDSDIIVIENAGNNEMFQQSNFFKIAKKYFCKNIKTDKKTNGIYSINENEQLLPFKNKLRNYRFALADLSPVRCCLALDGLSFSSDESKSSTASVIPLIIQALQNNYTTGMSSFKFNYNGCNDAPVLYMHLSECGKEIILPIGFTSPEYLTLDFNGESYSIAVRGVFHKHDAASAITSDVLDIYLSFLEMANTRLISIEFIDENNIIVHFNEQPGADFLIKNLEFVARERLKEKGKLTKQLADKIFGDVLTSRIKSAFELEVKYKICRN